MECGFWDFTLWSCAFAAAWRDGECAARRNMPCVSGSPRASPRFRRPELAVGAIFWAPLGGLGGGRDAGGRWRKGPRRECFKVCAELPLSASATNFLDEDLEPWRKKPCRYEAARAGPEAVEALVNTAVTAAIGGDAAAEFHGHEGPRIRHRRRRR